MKAFFAVVFACAFAVAAAAQYPTPPTPPPAKSRAKDSKTKKDEPPPKIEGLEIARGDKGYLGLQVTNGTFKLTFYDQKKKPGKIDFPRAALRWQPKNKRAEERVLLEPVDEHSLGSAKVIQPPYAFTLYMTLLKTTPEGTDQVGESYTVDFRQ